MTFTITAVATAVAAGILGLSAGTASASDVPEGYVYEKSFGGLYNDCSGAGFQGVREGKWADFRCVGKAVPTLYVLPNEAAAPPPAAQDAKMCTDGGGRVLKTGDRDYACIGGKYDSTGWSV
ncbi:hypothetical protein ACFV07_19520 [Streptomyces anulatus]|uniref:hypothetical protein n=1 Tax=Streptomyces anulatus TaxID=1892 RepID=UPI003696B20A